MLKKWYKNINLFVIEGLDVEMILGLDFLNTYINGVSNLRSSKENLIVNT